ncbi:MAG: DUF1207 domain-containing protein [Bacteroidetes bacterium]|nr:DUF1207 domain-containing protein [Bacteroidota bacterium]
MKITLIFSILLISIIISGITKASEDSLYFFSSDKVFIPTESSVIESRIGVTKYTDSRFLELNIGASADLLGLKKGNSVYSFGIDFFTYSNLRNENNFKFPVDAIDYLFGVNFNAFRKINAGYDISGRLRLSHISSHFEDGHIYERTDTIFTPVVFSKEFLDLAFVNSYRPENNIELKSMIALNYIFHAIPKEISKFSGQIGLEGNYYFSKVTSVYLSNDINIASVNGRTNLNNNLEAGLSFGKRNSRKIRLYYRYYDGQDYRGQYYGKYFNYNGIGIKFSI